MQHNIHQTSNTNEILQSNATEILPGVWLGNIQSALDTHFLHDKQIKCIINCTERHPFSNDPIIEIKYRLPVKDNQNESEINKFSQLINKTVNEIKKNLSTRNILVHCYAGQQRSPAILVAFLMKYGQMDIESAISAIKSKKSDIFHPKCNFSDALIIYQKYLSQNTSNP